MKIQAVLEDAGATITPMSPGVTLAKAATAGTEVPRLEGATVQVQGDPDSPQTKEPRAMPQSAGAKIAAPQIGANTPLPTNTSPRPAWGSLLPHSSPRPVGCDAARRTRRELSGGRANSLGARHPHLPPGRHPQSGCGTQRHSLERHDPACGTRRELGIKEPLRGE